MVKADSVGSELKHDCREIKSFASSPRGVWNGAPRAAHPQKTTIAVCIHSKILYFSSDGTWLTTTRPSYERDANTQASHALHASE